MTCLVSLISSGRVITDHLFILINQNFKHMKISRIIFKNNEGEVIAIKELTKPQNDILIDDNGSWEELERRKDGEGNITLFIGATVEACQSSLEIMADTFLKIEGKQYPTFN